MFMNFFLAKKGFVCKISLLADALGLKAKRARDDRVSCIQKGCNLRYSFFPFNFLQYASTLHQTIPRNYLVQINRE